MGYGDIYKQWQNDPEAYWLEQANAIDWDRPPSFALNDSRAPFYEWYSDAMVNTCFNAVDRHVISGHGDQAAIIYDSPITGAKSTTSFAELQTQTATLAGALRSKGVEKGDRVIIYMPMVPEALVAMLACTRIGAVHSVVFGGFAAKELATRIDDATPKAIIAGSCGIEPTRVVAYKPLLDDALEQARHSPDFCIIFQREQCRATLTTGRDFDWHAVQQSVTPADCLPVEGNHPAYILYTSGTTGQPKGVVRPTAGHLVSLNWTMKSVYNVDPGDVFWAASDVGWVVGHSYICYGPLIARNTTVLFEGKPTGTPDAGTFWRIIEEHKVRALFAAPTALRAIKREDPAGDFVERYDLSCLRTLYLAGERADPDTIRWAQRILNVPVVDHWWQTETGYSIAANPMGIAPVPHKTGAAGVAMPGYDIQILDDDGHLLPAGQLGAVAIKLPLPPGTLTTLWNADERYESAYLARFPGYYQTGDAGYIDSEGYVFIMSRTDDVINVAGHRLSTGALEEALTDHPDVAECAVIGVADPLKGQVPLGFICLSNNVSKTPEIVEAECIALVREKIGPVASFRLAVVVDRLPKTRSGKILRATMTRIADGTPFTVPATIDDSGVLSEIAAQLGARGFPRTEAPE